MEVIEATLLLTSTRKIKLNFCSLPISFSPSDGMINSKNLGWAVGTF